MQALSDAPGMGLLDVPHEQATNDPPDHSSESVADKAGPSLETCPKPHLLSLPDAKAAVLTAQPSVVVYTPYVTEGSLQPHPDLHADATVKVPSSSPDGTLPAVPHDDDEFHESLGALPPLMMPQEPHPITGSELSASEHPHPDYPSTSSDISPSVRKEKLFTKFMAGLSGRKHSKTGSESSVDIICGKKPSTGNLSEPNTSPTPVSGAESQHGVQELRKNIHKGWFSIFHYGRLSDFRHDHSSSDEMGKTGKHHSKPSHENSHVVPDINMSEKNVFDREIPITETNFVAKYHFCGNRIIGKGASSVVRLAEGTKDHAIYAVKEFRKKRKDETQKDYLKKLTSEYCISSLVHHPNVVETFDILRDGNHWYEVMEYCPGGDLFTVIKDGFLGADDVDICFKELLLGVQYLHNMGVAHRDLKPENLLIDSRGHLKITDFGVSEVFHVVWEKSPHLSKGVCGSAPYIAPEVLTGQEYDASKVDIWASGIIYYAMKFHGIPWAIASSKDTNYSHYLRHRGIGVEPLVRLSQGPQSLLRKMLEPDPEKRLTVDQVLQDPWLQNINTHTPSHFAKLLSLKSKKH